MKNLISIIFLCCLFSTAHAEQFNEDQLVGSWELVSCDGSYPGFTTNPYADCEMEYSYTIPSECKYLYLGVIDSSTLLPGTTGNLNQTTAISGGIFYPDNTNLDSTGWYDDYENFYENCRIIKDFFISNNGKLHILLGGTFDEGNWSFRFTIESFDNQKIILKSFDGKCTVTYQRVQSGSNLNTLKINSQSNETEYYNTKGIRLNNEQKGINIIRNGNKAVKKINR